MKSYREELWFETKTRRAYLNITRQVAAAVTKSGVQEGLVLVNAMHITASVYINDDEPGLLKDYDRFLDSLVPQGATYKHKRRAVGVALHTLRAGPAALRTAAVEHVLGARFTRSVRNQETEQAPPNAALGHV